MSRSGQRSPDLSNGRIRAPAIEAVEVRIYEWVRCGSRKCYRRVGHGHCGQPPRLRRAHQGSMHAHFRRQLVDRRTGTIGSIAVRPKDSFAPYQQRNVSAQWKSCSADAQRSKTRSPFTNVAVTFAFRNRSGFTVNKSRSTMVTVSYTHLQIVDVHERGTKVAVVVGAAANCLHARGYTMKYNPSFCSPLRFGQVAHKSSPNSS